MSVAGEWNGSPLFAGTRSSVGILLVCKYTAEEGIRATQRYERKLSEAPRDVSYDVAQEILFRCC